MAKAPKPPRTYVEFVRRFPKLEVAWRAMNEAEQEGPLDERTQRLVKLGISIGAMREGAVHSNVRKALALGITPEEIMQVVALAASNLGMPSTVAIYSWIRDVLEPRAADEPAAPARPAGTARAASDAASDPAASRGAQ